MRMSGLTPTEFSREEARPWQQAAALRNAYQQGVESVKAKIEAEQAVLDMNGEG